MGQTANSTIGVLIALPSCSLSSSHMGGTVWSINIMETNGSVTTYLSLAAFAVGQRFRFDCHLLGSAPPTWWATPWRLVGELAALSPSLLHLQCLTSLTLCVSWLALCKTVGSWSSLLAQDEPSCEGWCSLVCVWRH